VRIATWNVNSLKARMPRVEEWLGYAQADVLCLQETKLADDAFPSLAFSALGYDSVHHGHNQWNGVAILSRVGIEDVSSGFDTQAVDPYEGDARVLAATCGGVRVVSVYVPNGREVDSEFYERKLAWLEVMHDWLAATQHADAELAVLGDFNVAPEDRDVHDPKAWEGQVLASPPERAALQGLVGLGFTDAFRLFQQPEKSYTWWDYRMGAFRRNLGLRIDHVLLSGALAHACSACTIDTAPRKLERPSDHAPVMCEVAA